MKQFPFTLKIKSDSQADAGQRAKALADIGSAKGMNTKLLVAVAKKVKEDPEALNLLSSYLGV